LDIFWVPKYGSTMADGDQVTGFHIMMLPELAWHHVIRTPNDIPSGYLT
jgi:hypothetical protein